MKTKKKLNKASDSTTSDNLYGTSSIINEQGDAMNKNTEILANMMTQQKATNTILILAVVGIVAYMIYLNLKKK